MSNHGWVEAVVAAQPAPEVMALLSEVASAHGLHECARGGSGEIGVGAAPDAYAAVYVWKGGISLALSPDDARPLTALGLSCSAKNPTTHYIRVPNARLADEALTAHVRKALDAAFTRSWHGPRWKRGDGTNEPTRPVPRCPVHNMELSVSGWCISCDDQAPAL